MIPPHYSTIYHISRYKYYISNKPLCSSIGLEVLYNFPEVLVQLQIKLLKDKTPNDKTTTGHVNHLPDWNLTVLICDDWAVDRFHADHISRIDCVATEEITSRYVLNDFKKAHSVQGREMRPEEKEEGGYSLGVGGWG